MFSYGLLDASSTIASIVKSDVRINGTDHAFISAEPDFDGSSYIGKSWARPAPIVASATGEQGKQQLAIDGLKVVSTETSVALTDAELDTMFDAASKL
jgi:hypothetical protein